MLLGKFSDRPIQGSFITGIITNVDTKRHVVTVQPQRTLEPYHDVPIFGTPGNYCLPQVDDVGVVFFDQRGRPALLGTYPKFIKDGIEEQKDYSTTDGDVLFQTETGGRFMLLSSGLIRLINWTDQGFEIDERNGCIIVRSPSQKDIMAGVIERTGYVRRKGSITVGGSTSTFDLDNVEAVMKKVGSLDSAGTISSTEGTDLHEKRIEIKAPGSQTTGNPLGSNIFEDTIGHVVNNSSQEVLHTDSSLPLRRKTTYFDSSGITEIMREEIDVKGNVHVYISNQATQGIKLNTLVKLIADFFSVKLTTTNEVEVTSPQKIELSVGTNKVTTNSTGITITAGINTIVANSTGVTITIGSNIVTITSAGVTITAGANVASITPASIILTTGSNILTMTPASFTFTNPTLSGTPMIWT